MYQRKPDYLNKDQISAQEFLRYTETSEMKVSVNSTYWIRPPLLKIEVVRGNFHHFSVIAVSQ